MKRANPGLKLDAFLAAARRYNSIIEYIMSESYVGPALTPMLFFFSSPYTLLTTLTILHLLLLA